MSLHQEKLQRTTNIIFQLTAILILTLFSSMQIEVPLKIIYWQIVHFFLIALLDFYLDDYPQKTFVKTVLFFSSFFVFILYSFITNVFDELYIRIHGAIIILGNLLGRKIDHFFWKILTLIYLSLIIFFQLKNPESFTNIDRIILYTIGAIGLLAITERLSEINRNVWILHTAVLFFWISYQGIYHRESFIFLIGGLSYEISKIVINQCYLNKKKLFPTNYI